MSFLWGGIGLGSIFVMLFSDTTMLDTLSLNCCAYLPIRNGKFFEIQPRLGPWALVNGMNDARMDGSCVVDLCIKIPVVHTTQHLGPLLSSSI